MSATPAISVVLLALAGVFLILLLARAVLAGRRASRASRAKVTRWMRDI